MWDQRYGTQDYAYGTEPNDFLKAPFRQIPQGRVLSLAEGEGRNAVFLAKHGYRVTAVDASRVGLDKAQRLAQENNVAIECVQADLADFTPGDNEWDGIISIFCPLPSGIRRALYARLEKALKPGGVFLLEAYTPAQANNDTGGGKDTDTMQTSATLRQELAGLHFVHLQELERPVIEGRYHTGLGAVVQAIAVK